MANVELLEVMSSTQERVPAVVSALKRLYGLTDGQLADALGMARKDFQTRRAGATRFTIGEVAALAVLFDLPVTAFLERSPAEVVAMASERDPELLGPFPSSGCLTGAERDALLTAIDGRWARVPLVDVGRAVG